MDTNIEPQSAALGVFDPVPTGVVTSQESPLAPLLFTLDNGKYAPKLDILYPPGTQFYKHTAEGEFIPVLPHPEGDWNIEFHEGVNTEITLEFMVEKAIEFLHENGYSVSNAPLGDSEPEPKPEPEPEAKAAPGTAYTAGGQSELATMLGKLRSLFAAHATTHAAIEEAHGLISKIEQYL